MADGLWNERSQKSSCTNSTKVHGTNAAHVTGFGYRDVMERNGDRVRLNESKMERSEGTESLKLPLMYRMAR